jgi:hypothetical protein
MLSCTEMLYKRKTNLAPVAAIQRYLFETLGVSSELRPWPAAGQLPFFLQEAFAVHQATFHGHDLLLAVEQRPKPPKISELRTQVARLRSEAQLPVIYATEALASYERRRLIECRVPFLVPGNQLYLPDLGIDLREYFRTPRAQTGAAVSPATQAVLITMLLSRHWRNDWALSEIVAKLGYTAMTLTRIMREFEAARLADIQRHGRERRLHTEGTPEEIWNRARVSMRSPVKRSIWVPTFPGNAPALRLAGFSALAQLTPLADPPSQIYAIGPNDWRQFKHAQLASLPQPADGHIEWQLWSYSPEIESDSRTVDPLSLMLSLDAVTDERVQMALDELRNRLPW